ncbi:hypothetical protein AR457_05600 [Streptomyces agglomeratus]|uniref:DUF350 domain-containing protein n=1 Tax=Streptomyces agglomeratus TaxID=285458 RepID=A0A1E5P382_9ACTN|nr:DUF350 domain-containing protein [Streptomyces agglomeratus]OEJ24018.1 hypothetical protein AS594_05530 [Streptomyces agglomeratus]OEJ41977.1 hypothetical protein BGK70_31040 [Streptomyces agglomeratus]OEJ43645.1 hypothetical protein AR457_05600 [Streptomyces agglomeratus]OEJ54468.1 hypothetical protein BGK72_30355 [Streptomyces agglomeratus]OEJ61838.1 hypothetical protein BGM19_31260 [Streptomyces agglomeratus]
MEDIVNGLGRSAAYGALGVVLLTLGIFLVDALTPGKLGRQIWQERNRNAALLLSSALLGIGGIVFTSIWTTYTDFGKGLASTAAFGLLGLVMMAVAFWVVDVVTPGKLGETLVQEEPHPAVWVTASCNVAVAAIISASIA